MTACDFAGLGEVAAEGLHVYSVTETSNILESFIFRIVTRE